MKKSLLFCAYVLLSMAAFSKTSFSDHKDSAMLFFQQGIAQNSLKHYSVASNYFDSAIALYPEYEQAYKEKALVNLQMRRTDIAKATLVKAYELDTTDAVVINQLAQLYFD